MVRVAILRPPWWPAAAARVDGARPWRPPSRHGRGSPGSWFEGRSCAPWWRAAGGPSGGRLLRVHMYPRRGGRPRPLTRRGNLRILRAPSFRQPLRTRMPPIKTAGRSAPEMARTTAAGHPPRPDMPKKTNGRFERQTVSSRDPADCCLGHTHRGTAGPNGKRGDYAKFLPGAWWTRRRSFRNLAEISRPAAVAPAAATRDCRRSSLSGSCAGPTHGPRCATPCVWTCRVTVVDRFGCLCPPAPVQCGGSPDLLRRPAAT